ncbi:AEC family transporter [Marinobacterium stanieri]|uniref:AEC family transporter n=1 Tax=Marinobacterium stanieri TaxID=49186 RepID=UPI003A91B506
MLSVLSITAPIFILIGLGYLAVKSGILPAAAAPGMGRFVLYFSLPALIFGTLSRMEFSEVIEPSYLLVYATASLLALLIGVTLHHKLVGNTLPLSGVKGMGMAVSNSAFIGYPVLLQVFGEPPAQAFAMSLMVENLLIIPLALIIIESGGRDDATSRRQHFTAVFARVLKNPLVLAIGAGMLVSLLQLPIPQVIDKTLSMLAQASAAVALFSIGGVLVGTSIRGNVSAIPAVVAGKLLLHPLLVFLLLMLVPGMDPDLRLSMLLLASMPMFSVFPIIAGNYGFGQTSASILIITTLMSFFTLTLMIGLLT